VGHQNRAICRKDGAKMGATVLEFKPRESLIEFVKGRENVSLIRRNGGRKSSENMAIHGDNLAALAALKAGFGTAKEKFKVDVIAIDPPYNVGGNQGYQNVWKGKSEKERDWAGDHGKFLDFMEPRLKIARQLLSEQGVIFINICDGEYARLKILMNQIFGEENDIGTFIWNKGRGAAGSHVSASHEYIICYAKDKTKAPSLQQKKPYAELMIKKSKELLEQFSFEEAQKQFKKWISEMKAKGLLKPGEAAYSEIHPTNYRLFHADNSCAQDDPKGKRCRKALAHPKTKKPCPVPKNGWKWTEETLDRLVSEGKIYFGHDHSVVPKIIRYLDEQMFQRPLTMIFDGSDGKDSLPSGVTFTTPKPISLLKTILSFYPEKNARVLDFFGGSGATAHAVVDLNKEDGGKRSWILVEEMGSTFHKVLVPRMKHADPSNDFSTYEVETVPVGGRELLKKFNQHSYDFLSSYHFLDESESVLAEGMNIVGIDKSKDQLVAITVPTARKSKNFFVEELAAIKQTIKKVKAKSVLIYTLHGDTEEPWLGVDKSVLSGTHCKTLSTVGVPDELVKEWNEVLEAMAA